MEINFKIDTNNKKDLMKILRLCKVLIEASEDESVIKDDKIVADNKKEISITQEELRMKLITLAKNKGKDIVKKLLTDVGAEKLSDVKQSNYSELAMKIEEVM